MLQCLKWKEVGLNFSRIALDVTALSFLRPEGVIPTPNLTSHLKRALSNCQPKHNRLRKGLRFRFLERGTRPSVTDPPTNYRPEKSLDLISVRAWLTSPSRYHGLTLLPLLSFKIHRSWCMGAEQRPSLPGTVRVFLSKELH